MAQSEKDAKQKSRRTIKNNLYMLGLVWRISPARVILAFLESLSGFGGWIFMTVVFMKYLFGAAEFNRSFHEVGVFLGFSVLGWLLLNLFESWYEQRFCPVNNQLLYRELNKRLFDKACNVDISCYENAEFYNSYTKASSEVFIRGVSVVDNLSMIFSSALSSAYVIYVIFTINIWAGFATMLPVTANLILGKRAGRIDYKKNMEMVPFIRRQTYVNRVFYLQQYAKEIRLTGVFNVLANTYREAMQGIVGVSRKYWKRLTMINGFKATIALPLFFEGTWLLGAYLAMVAKTVAITEFIVLVNAAVSTTHMFQSFTKGVVTAYENALYIDNLTAFMAYRECIPENQGGLSVPEKVETLEMRNVRFRYGGAHADALGNINITLEKGSLVSIVGHNGSGKSTLVKLLMRLYDPTEGEILLNGVDIRLYDLKQYRALVGSAFQDYQILSMTVVENVVMGNATEGDRRRAAMTALDRSGVRDRIERLPGGGESVLTREFDDEGVNLSSGEAQKVAVARSFAKRSAILLLDEPSSALDPVAEHRMYRNFIELCRGRGGRQKISVFISHRLSTATVADHIYMMENGEIIEEGSHAELMRRRGAYYAMFSKQAENYLMETESL